MRNSAIFLLLIILNIRAQALHEDILIENVNVINILSGEVISNRDVIISGNRISSISDHLKNDVRPSTVLNGRDKYLVPGLWDMHVHIMDERWYDHQLPLLRANGITGFREMAGNLKVADNVKYQMQKDRLPYFRFVASGHLLDGKKPYWEGSISVVTTDDAIRIVDSLIDVRSDFAKIYSLLGQDEFYAIAKMCKEKGFPFAGHVPSSVWLTGASDAGMASMEHLIGFLIEANSKSDSAFLLNQLSVQAFEKGNRGEIKKIENILNCLLIDHFSEDKLRFIAKILKKNQTYIVPTLVTLRGRCFLNDTSFTNDPRLKYMSTETRDYWKEQIDNGIKNISEVEWQNKRNLWYLERQILKILIEEKVIIMAGTDSDNPYAFPGFSLHDELALFVELGMSPIEALRTATIIPADYLKMTDSLGTIENGKLADMVLFDENPLVNIRNSTKINTVIANGKIYSNNYIDSVLKK